MSKTLENYGTDQLEQIMSGENDVISKEFTLRKLNLLFLTSSSISFRELIYQKQLNPNAAIRYVVEIEDKQYVNTDGENDSKIIASRNGYVIAIGPTFEHVKKDTIDRFTLCAPLVDGLPKFVESQVEFKIVS